MYPSLSQCRPPITTGTRITAHAALSLDAAVQAADPDQGADGIVVTSTVAREDDPPCPLLLVTLLAHFAPEPVNKTMSAASRKDGTTQPILLTALLARLALLLASTPALVRLQEVEMTGMHNFVNPSTQLMTTPVNLVTDSRWTAQGQRPKRAHDHGHPSKTFMRMTMRTVTSLRLNHVHLHHQRCPPRVLLHRGRHHYPQRAKGSRSS